MTVLDWFELRARQTYLLTKKNMILAKRTVKASVIQVIVPFLFVFMLFIFQFAIKANEQNSEVLKSDRAPARDAIAPYPQCIRSRFTRGPCIRVLYTVTPLSERPLVETIISTLLSQQNIPPVQSAFFDTAELIDNYMLAHPNSTQGAYLFNVTRNGAATHVRYAVQVNLTATTSFGEPVDVVTYTQNPMVYAVERALAHTLVGDPNLSFNIDLQAFAHPEALPYDVIVDAGPSLFFAALMFNFVITLGRVVAEREEKLREGMNQMGLRTISYWLSHLIMSVVFNVGSVMVLIISGAIFQFRFFLKNDFGLYFFLFFLFALAMVPFAFVLSTLVARAKTATTLGFVIFLLGLIVQIFQGLIYADSTATFWKGLFSFLPFVLLSKGIQDIGAYSTSVSMPGMRWNQRFHNSSFPLVRVYNWLVWDFFFYCFLTWYLDNVIPSQFGVARPFYFFLMPSYWTGKVKRRSDDHHFETVDDSGFDDAVRAEFEMAKSDSFPEDAAIRLYNIRKTFVKRSCCGMRVSRFTAVNGLSFHVEKNSLFCLLGHNGAGKSTLFNMMTGLFGGDGTGLVFDYDLHSSMRDIRGIMGVCPQHDILWGELTAREHLELFAALKGMTLADAKTEAIERLRDVDLLDDAADKVVSAFSGGMRRRLSTAIAFCADPKIIFLDEPTTGMDPVSRRKVWNMIQSKKGGRAIILTTHSMEEADVLGDRIGIVAHGQLSTIGTALELKSRFGAGYHITLVADDETAADTFVRAKLGNEVERVVKSSGALLYLVPRDLIDSLPEFLAAVEKSGKAKGIRDVQLSLTTLESVFIAVSDKDEEAFAAGVQKQQSDASGCCK
eukprot:a175002_751.p1 GENE.a175002_751~~a175002_751.p1  ORF type:complete len:854 (-),score=472.33 a175002_751:20-2533(-)